MPSRKRRSTSKKKVAKKKVEEIEEEEEEEKEESLAQDENEIEEEEEVISKPQKKKTKIDSPKRAVKKGAKQKASVSPTRKTNAKNNRKRGKEVDDDDDEEEEEIKSKTRSSTRRKSQQKKEENEEEEEDSEENEEMNDSEEEEEKEEEETLISPTGRPMRKATKKSWVEDSDSEDSDEYYNDDDEDYDNNIENITNDSPFVGHKGKRRSFVKKSKAKDIEESDDDGDEDDEEDEVNEDGEKVPKLRLLSRILKGGRDTRLIKEWAEKYKISPVAAVADLINLVIESCGCPYRVTPKKLASGNVEKILESLISSSWAKKVNKKVMKKKKAMKGKGSKDVDAPENEKVGDNEGEDEEVDEGLEESEDNDEVVNYTVLNNKKSREQFLSFWDKVIQISKDGFLYDDYLLSVLVSWINSLTNSTTRSFRRTATSVALQITYSLIKVIQELNAVLEKNKRQQDSEKKRNGGRATAKLKDLEEQAEEIKRNTDIIAETVNTVYTYVVGIRFRDILPSIRAECIAKVAEFIVLWPEKLLVNGYLKYLGWGLSDKTASVRLEAVRALTTVYSSLAATYGEGAKGKVLRNFWERFKKRIKEMACDVDVQVAVETVNLFKFLAPMYFTDTEFHDLFKLINSDIPEVRRALGSFINATALGNEKKDSGANDSDRSLKRGESVFDGDEEEGEDEEEEDSDEVKISKIIETVRDFSGLPGMPCYVADALWNNNGNSDVKVLKCWKTMTSMLLKSSDDTNSSVNTSDSDISIEPLNEVEQRILAGILSTSCKLAAGIPITQSARTSVPGGKEGEQLRVQQDEMTAEVAGELPLLLKKYGAEEAIVEDLLEIIPALSLLAISALRLERAFTDILSEVSAIFAKSVNEDVLQAAAAGLSYMISGVEGPHKQTPEAEAEAKRLVESIISSSDTENIIDNEAAMRRILILYQQVDLHENPILQENVISKAKGILDMHSDNDEKLVTAMRLVYQDILWKFSSVSIESVDDIQGSIDLIDDICAERDTFVTNIGAILVQKNNANEIRDLAYTIASDIATVFTPNLSATLYRKFAYTLPDEISPVIREYFIENVYNVMHKRSCDYESANSNEESEMEVEDNENGDDETTKYESVTKRIVEIAAAYAKICCTGALGSAYTADVISLYHLYREPDTKRKVGSTSQKKAPTSKKRHKSKDDDDDDDEYDGNDEDVSEDEMSADVNEEEVKCLVKCQEELDNIAKTTLRKIREHDKSKEWESVALALQRCYSESIGKENDAEDSVGKNRRHFNDVAKWLSFSYGPVPFGELRVSLLRVVQESVLWALDKECEKRVGILAPLGVSYFASKFAASEAKFIRDQIEKKVDEESDTKDLEGLKLFNKVLDKALKKVAPEKNLENEAENEN